ncbi:MAG: hypothetical protein ACM3JH_13165 [Acidithiobacillales bacterium]
MYTPDCNSPIVLNLGLLPYELTDAADGVQFDIDGDGVRDQIGWTAAARPLAFLWLDRNADGFVTDGRELFGNHTFLRDGREATNGFQALAELDFNADGLIDAADPIWWELMLWVDVNHDGISQSSEIGPLALSSVTAIGVDYSPSLRRDRFGNLFRYRAAMWLGGLTVSQRPVYDIFFVGAETGTSGAAGQPVREPVP